MQAGGKNGLGGIELKTLFANSVGSVRRFYFRRHAKANHPHGPLPLLADAPSPPRV